MRELSYFKRAFTMLEMVFVIVVLGILAALAIPRLDRDRRQEAADNILSAIRYTQHLALVDDKCNPFDSNWQKSLWAIRFTTGDNAFYTIASDTNENGSISKSESAIDPANGKYFYNSTGAFSSRGSDESPNIFLAHLYGINSISFAGGCSSHHIAFDNYGRPFNGIASASDDYSKYMQDDCNITFDFSDDTKPFSIIIKRESGYAYIDGEPDS